MPLNDIKTVAEIIALISAAVFFIYKLVDGWGLVNLSIELKAERKPGPESDLVSVLLKLVKGDRGSLELQTIELKCKSAAGPPDIVRITLNYPLKLRANTGLKDEETRVHWETIDEKRPLIHLPPGESTQYSQMFTVPRGAPCTVEAIVVGKRPVSTRRGQWRASVDVL
jgi:hypothetical protein